MTDWIEITLAKVDCTKKKDPGRATIHRLNRAEYNNTIRDLVGVDFQPAEDFPSDDVGYVFDNIGDVLSLSPVLMERYLTAAESIAQRAVLTEPPKPAQHPVAANFLLPRGREREPAVRTMTTDDTLYTTYRITEPGEYVFRVRAYGQQAGNEPPRPAAGGAAGRRGANQSTALHRGLLRAARSRPPDHPPPEPRRVQQHHPRPPGARLPARR